jgi:hypothetical protein
VLALALPVATLAGAAAITVPANDYLPHYLETANSFPFGDVPILHFLEKQPGWQHGDAQVAAGFAAYFTLAGPHLSHPLSYIPDNESCAAIQAAAQRGFVVLAPSPTIGYVHAPACMDGIKPAGRVGGGVKIYAPADLLAH